MNRTRALFERIDERWPGHFSWTTRPVECVIVYAFEEGVKQGREDAMADEGLGKARCYRGEDDNRERLKRSVNDGLEPIGDVIRSIFSDDIERRRAERDEIASEARIEKQLGELVSNDIDDWKESK